MRFLAMGVLLAGCAGMPNAAPDTARPDRVTLYRDTLTVTTSDGALCTAVRQGRGGPWQGVLMGCVHAWPVTVRQPSAVARQVLVRDNAAPWVIISSGGTPIGFAPPRAPTS